jgi:UDP-N-acetylmuramate--alanine ligase
MHIFFAGIGGAGIGPLAQFANEAGFTVSGSDKQDSQAIDYLKAHGITAIQIGQGRDIVESVHKNLPIDWFVYSSALTLENPNAPELLYCQEQGIKTSKRDEFLNYLLSEKKLKLIAIAGTQGKTTTTAMVVWLLSQLGLPLSYALPAKTSFGDIGQYAKDSQYFVYEADEFDRNFLAFEPYLSLISGVSWDHHEIYPTREEYKAAFLDFISQSDKTLIWREDADYLGLEPDRPGIQIEDSAHPDIEKLKLVGHYNRLDGWLAIKAAHLITKEPLGKLVDLINQFPGLQRRMEQLIPGLFSDEAHTPEKIRGGMSVALEMAAVHNQPVIVVYEPLTNRRQHYMLDEYKDCFAGAQKVYWLPSYLAREDPGLRIIPPDELISHLPDPSLAEPAQLNEELKKIIQKHLAEGAMVVGMAGGAGHSLDEWLRQQIKPA